MAQARISPFEVKVSAEEIADLRDRLARTRWTDQLPDAGWDYGTEKGFLRRLCDYWQKDYDFAGYLERLNAFPQFLAEVDGEQIQFYHARSKVETARPLVLVHGWPGSVVEFLDLIEPLSNPQDPADAFHIIVASLPGYGYSGPTRHQNVNVDTAARMVNAVMLSLGYDRYFAQGGDWGSIVTSRLAETFPEHVAALHVNMAPGGPDNPFAPVSGLNEAEAADWGAFLGFLYADGGYSHLQSTRPQTLAFGMNDSPAGLAAWLIDKFHSWTDHGGDLESVFGFDHLLDNLTLYWLTQTAGSSFRLYFESNGRGAYRQSKVGVPTGVARFAGEPFRWPRPLAEQSYRNIVEWREFPIGGHFAAFQRPDDFLDAVRGFFRGQTLTA
ncbi:MAG: epoxide hydrolase [Rhizorhabdus sp.]|nr:epoxide hydrolase [Rhizorhabdus sp.]